MFGKNWTKSLIMGICGLLIVCCAILQGDVVYHNDGREIKGTVQQSGDNVIVTLPDGKKVTFAKSDILYIAKGSVDGAAELPTTPKSDASAPSTQTPDKPESETTKPSTGVTFDDSDDSSRPKPEFESTMALGSVDPAQTLYEYLRRRPSGPGSGGPGLEELIKTARIRIHERQRKAGKEWLNPEDFARRREAFAERLEEAEDYFKQARKIKPKNQSQQKKKNALMEQCHKKLLEAAKSVPDPLLRRFLLGAAYESAGNYNKAVQMYYRCTKDAPVIAGFYQGLGNSLIGNKVYKNAIHSLMRALMLTEDQPTALAEMREALQKCPGTLVQDPAMKNTKNFLKHFSDVKPRKLSDRRKYWLLPGRVSCRPELIPELDYDRLDIKQGVAVPITQSRLIVGKDIVKDADYVIVRLTNWLYLPAKVESLGSNVEMAILYVPDVQFNPMSIERSRPFKKGEYYNALAADIFPSMSSEAQTREIIIKSSLGLNPSFEGGLLPGQGTAPLINSTGNLVGFLNGKLKTDSGEMRDRIIPVNTSSKFLRRVKRKSSKDRSGRNPQQNLIKVPGHSFIVFAIGTEDFSE